MKNIYDYNIENCQLKIVKVDQNPETHTASCKVTLKNGKPIIFEAPHVYISNGKLHAKMGDDAPELLNEDFSRLSVLFTTLNNLCITHLHEHSVDIFGVQVSIDRISVGIQSNIDQDSAIVDTVNTKCIDYNGESLELSDDLMVQGSAVVKFESLDFIGAQIFPKWSIVLFRESEVIEDDLATVKNLDPEEPEPEVPEAPDSFF
jgi:hypothetical protein